MRLRADPNTAPSSADGFGLCRWVWALMSSEDSTLLHTGVCSELGEKKKKTVDWFLKIISMRCWI